MSVEIPSLVGLRRMLRGIGSATTSEQAIISEERVEALASARWSPANFNPVRPRAASRRAPGRGRDRRDPRALVAYVPPPPRPSGFLYVPSELTSEEADALRVKWREAYGPPRRAPWARALGRTLRSFWRALKREWR